MTLRRALRTGAGWGLVFGLLVISNASGFRSAYPTRASRQLLARTIGHNPGLEALFGTTSRIDTVAGFTAWRTLGVVGFLGSVVGLLLATRLLRGEEEAGRWDLVVAGPTTRQQATVRALGALGGGLALAWVLTALLAATEFAAGASAFFAAALVAPMVLFTAVGAVTSQLAGTRRRASAMAGVGFGAFYAVRLVADSGTGVAWLRWATPLGWVEEMHPLEGRHLLPLVLVAASVAAAAVAAVMLAAVRDVGAGALPSDDVAEARTALLGGPVGLDVRLTRPAALGWAAGTAAMGVLLGLLARSAGEATAASKAVTDAIARLGGRNLGARTYLGLSFLIVATLLCVIAAGHVGAARDEESSGRLEQLVAGPVSRGRWLSGRAGVGAAVVVAISLLTGLAAWAGAASQDAGVGLRSLAQAGLNTAPPALMVLGLGTLVLGALPHLARPFAYGLVAWSFVVEFVGALIKANRWLLDLSLFHHIAPAPATPPHWDTAAIMVALATAAALGGVTAFGRRDLNS